MHDAIEVQRCFAAVRERIGPSVRLVAVTKGFPVDAVRLALRSGCPDVGENYAQELVAKATELAEQAGPAPRWHMIGQIQRNKVRRLAPHVAVWHSVDRVEIIDEIARHAPGATILIQVDLTGEPGKGGCPPGATEALVARCRRHRVAPGGVDDGRPGRRDRGSTGVRGVAEVGRAVGCHRVVDGHERRPRRRLGRGLDDGADRVGDLRAPTGAESRQVGGHADRRGRGPSGLSPKATRAG